MINEEKRRKIYARFRQKVEEVGRTEAYHCARKAVKPWAAYSTVVSIVKKLEAEEAAKDKKKKKKGSL